MVVNGRYNLILYQVVEVCCLVHRLQWPLACFLEYIPPQAAVDRARKSHLIYHAEHCGHPDTATFEISFFFFFFFLDSWNYGTWFRFPLSLSSSSSFCLMHSELPFSTHLLLTSTGGEKIESKKGNTVIIIFSNVFAIYTIVDLLDSHSLQTDNNNDHQKKTKRSETCSYFNFAHWQRNRENSQTGTLIGGISFSVAFWASQTEGAWLLTNPKPRPTRVT